MDSKQIVALLMPFALLAVMYPTFHLIARKFGNSAGWYSGLVLYWIIWGAAFPLVLLGSNTILNLVRPQKIELGGIILAAIPIIFAASGRIFLKMQYEKATSWALFGLLATAVGNGVFEEILWRGTYWVLFPDSIVFQVIWPSVGFALWHYAPGSVSTGRRVLKLMVGAAFFGLLLSVLTRQTNSLAWPILAHTLAGIVMVV